MKIHLGYELKSGNAVSIPLRHLAVIGRTQDSGKTTTLEALIRRADLRALAFVTKRGEKTFSVGRVIVPYFEEPGDNAAQPLWQFVASLLETALQETMKIQRSSIMRVCDFNDDRLGKWDKPRTLKQVAANIELALPKAKGFDGSMFLQLREYFRIVLPQIDAQPWAQSLELKPGLNIMYLERLTAEMQALVMTSCLNWVRTREKNMVVIVPEAWKFTQEKRASPVMPAAAQYIRECGVLNNWLWLDSQDLVGIAPEIRKQVGVWILGVQGEAIEAKRTIEQLPTKGKKPKVDEVQELRRGQFFVSWGEGFRKVYVQPAWLNEDSAYLVAMTGSAPPAEPKGAGITEDEMWRERAEKLQEEVKDLTTQLENLTIGRDHWLSEADSLKNEVNKLMCELKELKDAPKPGNPLKLAIDNPPVSPAPPCSVSLSTSPNGKAAHWVEAVWPQISNQERVKLFTYKLSYQEWIDNVWPMVLDNLSTDPRILKLIANRSEIEVTTKKQVVMLDGGSLRGKLALFISEGFFDAGVKAAECYGELRRRGTEVANANLSRELKTLCGMGFLTMEGNTQATTYRRVPGVKVTKRTIESS